MKKPAKVKKNISEKKKRRLKLAKSFNLWFTGLPSSGKTTTAIALKQHLHDHGINSIHLDGDVVRKGLTADLGFSAEDREENNRRIIHVSEIIVSSNVPVLTTFISPYRKTREFARQTIPDFIEVFVNTSLEECIRRDVKGLYKKARAGEIKNMTGLDDPYEVPENPEIMLSTTEKDIEENIDHIVDYLIAKAYLDTLDTE